MSKKPNSALSKKATIRDFGGGWNAADNPFNLASRFLPLADNTSIGIDGALSPRFGDRLFSDLRDGTIFPTVSGNVDITTTNVDTRVRITKVAHGFSNGDHITISGAVNIGGIPATDINRTHGVFVVDANNIEFHTRNAATSTTTATQNITYVRDDHTLAGDIIDSVFFQNYLVLFDSIGEIASVDEAGAKLRIWSHAHAQLIAGTPAPWRYYTHVSSDTIKQTLLCVNGRLNDKPLEINFQRTAGAIVQFLVDPASGSNTFVPKGDLILCFNNYAMIFATDGVTGPAASNQWIDISAAGEPGVYVGNPSPDDAVQFDLGRISSAVDPSIIGVGFIRDRVFVAFYDTGLLGSVGSYTGAIHTPEFKDQVPQYGALNHRVICNIGNDLIMTDFAGVPSFAQSQQSLAIVPDRFSDLIDPALNKHLSRLSATVQKNDVFAIYNIRDKEYMLFVPKFDGSSNSLGTDPFYTLSTLDGQAACLMIYPNHQFETGDFVTISGATAFTGVLVGDLNRTAEVLYVIDENTIIVDLGAVPSLVGNSGGGSSVVATPVNDETIGYIYQHNPKLKIRRWKRYRGLRYTCGTVSKGGRVFFCYQGKVYQFGTYDRPVYADKELDYDARVWLNNNAYDVGYRVREATGSTWVVYECAIAHTSAAGGTFSDDRTANPTYWSTYTGIEIDWAAETTWSDFNSREAIKTGDTVFFDAQGTGRFTVQAYADSLYPFAKSSYRLPDAAIVAPVYQASVEFVGADIGGFGAGTQPFGGGRRTREPLDIGFPFDGRVVKLRMFGSSKEKLNIASITLLYKKGA